MTYFAKASAARYWWRSRPHRKLIESGNASSAGATGEHLPGAGPPATVRCAAETCAAPRRGTDDGRASLSLSAAVISLSSLSFWAVLIALGIALSRSR